MKKDMKDLFSPDNWEGFRSGPLYLQLKKCIEAAIHTGRLEPDTPLPSEREIAALTKFSRVTVRKAVQELVRDGLVIQRHGSGTFVAPQVPRFEQSLSRLTSFSEDMVRRGLSPRSVWLSRDIYDASPEESIILGLSPYERVCRFERLRFADDMPLAIERTTLSEEYVPSPSAIDGSLYAMLEKEGNRPVRAIQRLSAFNVGQDDAELLKVQVSTACLRIERVSYLDSGLAVELTRSIYRGDAYDFVAELQVNKSSFMPQF
jgi:GntR family transcriptional regulator